MESLKSRLAKGYSRSAPAYEAMASPMYLLGIQQLLPYLRLPPMPAILDVGCGTGVNLFEAARWFSPCRQLCGIDLSEGMIEVALAKAVQIGIPASFVIGDAEELPFANATFDLVLCNSVLHWFKDKTKALREMHRTLRPGGQIALIGAAAPGFSEWFNLIDALMQIVQGPNSAALTPPLPTPTEIAAFIQSAGFRIDHLVSPSRVGRITDPEAFVRLMSIVAPHWAAELTAEAQQVVEQCAATAIRVGWPAGFISTWVAVQAIGTRIE